MKKSPHPRLGCGAFLTKAALFVTMSARKKSVVSSCRNEPRSELLVRLPTRLHLRKTLVDEFWLQIPDYSETLLDKVFLGLKSCPSWVTPRLTKS